MSIIFKIDLPKNFTPLEKETFCDLLKQQRKVTEPTLDKVNRCELLCICKLNDQIVSIGAIKPKTNSDFNSEKANLVHLRDDFKLELGYCFTLPEYTGKGYSSAIVKYLLSKIEGANLMASTELRADNSMVHILKRNGFKQYGNPWKSSIHGGALGLYLKFLK